MNTDLFNYILDKASSLKDYRLSEPKSPKELLEEFPHILLGDEPDEDLKSLIDGVIKHSINTQNPRFLNQLYGGTSEVTWMGELLTAILNTSMATYEIAPLATLCEKEIFKSINQTIGFNKHEGLFTPGGSYANMLGLQCARYKKSPEAKVDGLYGLKPQYVFVSKDAHYSTEKAMGLMGLGVANLVKVETDDHKKLCSKDLKKKVSEVIAKGGEALCVVSTAATTVWGAYDPFESINEVCKDFGIWHHIDAAWGGLSLWSSEKRKALFKGVESADSITLDFHKLMSSSLTKGVFLTRHPEVLKGANAGGGTKYIFHEQEGESYDTGVYALQCGRKVDSLPLWMFWKSIGTKGFRDKIDQFFGLQAFLTDFIESSSNYTLLHKPEFMNFCFHIKSPNNLSDGDFTLAVREELMKRGNFMVNYSSSSEHGVFFRLVLNHWGVTKEILQEFFVELEAIKADLT